MKRILRNLTTGRMCSVNVILAVTGISAMVVTSGAVQEASSAVVGAYFFAQALLANRDMRSQDTGKAGP